MAMKTTGFDATKITVTDAEYSRAVEAGQGEPRAQSVRFDESSQRLQIELQDGIAVMIPVAFVQGLGGASKAAVRAPLPSAFRRRPTASSAADRAKNSQSK